MAQCLEVESEDTICVESGYEREKRKREVINQVLNEKDIPHNVWGFPEVASRLVCIPEQLDGESWLRGSVKAKKGADSLVSVILFDVSGSQMKSAQILLDLCTKIAQADNANQTFVIPFGSRRELLRYNARRDFLETGVHTPLSRMPPMSAAKFATKLREDLSTYLNQQGTNREYAKAFKPFHCKTKPDAIVVGLRLLKNRGFFDGRSAKLIFLGDGEFDGGLLSLRESLSRLEERDSDILEKFVKMIIVPSPHTAPSFRSELLIYVKQFCDRIHGLFPTSIESFLVGERWVKEVMQVCNFQAGSDCFVRNGSPFQAIYSSSPVICHQGIQRISRADLAKIFHLNQTACHAALSSVESIINDPLQLDRLSSDRLFSSLYAGLTSFYRIYEEPGSLRDAIRRLMDRVSTLLSLSGDVSSSHRLILKKMAEVARRDPVVHEWTRVNEKKNVAHGTDFLLVAKKADALEAVVLTDMASAVPKAATRRAILRWMSRLQVFPADSDDMLNMDFDNILKVPLNADAGDYLRVVKLLPTLSQEESSWSSRVVLQVLLMCITNLSPRSTECTEDRSVEPHLANLFLKTILQNEWGDLVELSESRAENFSGFFVQLIVQAVSVRPDLKIADDNTIKMYKAIARLQQIRSLVGSSHSIVRIEHEFFRPPEGKVPKFGKLFRRNSSKTAYWPGRFMEYCESFYDSHSDRGLVHSQLEPFLYGVPVDENGDFPDELLHSLCCDVAVWFYLSRGERGKAKSLILHKQQRQIHRLQIIDDVLATYSFCGDNIPEFLNEAQAQQVVRDFYVRQGGNNSQVKCKEVFSYSCKNLLAYPQVCQFAHLDHQLVEIALQGCGRVTIDEAGKAMGLEGKIEQFEINLLGDVCLPVHGHDYVRDIVLSTEDLQHISDKIWELLNPSQNDGRILDVGDDITAIEFEPCGICLDKFTVTSTSWVALECGHRVCGSCFDHWKERPTRGLLTLPKCPFCRCPASDAFLSKCGAHRLLRSLQAMSEMMKDHYIMVCSSCSDCYIGARRTCRVRIEAIDTECHKCLVAKAEKEYLELARREHGRDVNSEKAFKKLLESKRALIKRCPVCDTAIEKNGGCNHITCVCGTHWCWRCNRYKDNRGGKFNSSSIYGHTCR